jgi:hypothetical protein
MAWVRFEKDFDWKPKPAVTLGYLKGMVVSVTRSCAEQAVARGVAAYVKSPTRQERHGIYREVGKPELGDGPPAGGRAEHRS